MLRVIGIRFQFHLQTIKLFAITTYFMDLVKMAFFFFRETTYDYTDVGCPEN